MTFKKPSVLRNISDHSILYDQVMQKWRTRLIACLNSAGNLFPRSILLIVELMDSEMRSKAPFSVKRLSERPNLVNFISLMQCAMVRASLSESLQLDNARSLSFDFETILKNSLTLSPKDKRDPTIIRLETVEEESLSAISNIPSPGTPEKVRDLREHTSRWLSINLHVETGILDMRERRR